MIRFPGRRAFCDTSFFFASFYPRDVNYRRAGQILQKALEEEIILFTTWDIISETATLLLYRFSSTAAIRFLDDLKPLLSIVLYDDSIRQEAERVFRLLIRDKRISFCDAISFVVVKTVLDDIACLSFDEDFSRLGLNLLTY
jgi:predicted nucleic acid-binding protein